MKLKLWSLVHASPSLLELKLELVNFVISQYSNCGTSSHTPFCFFVWTSVITPWISGRHGTGGQENSDEKLKELGRKIN